MGSGSRFGDREMQNFESILMRVDAELEQSSASTLFCKRASHVASPQTLCSSTDSDRKENNSKGVKDFCLKAKDLTLFSPGRGSVIRRYRPLRAS
jgi:hypothetical protein